ncbi:P-loop containing nucleoside triphosphate hydrolase protein [Schizopora paradoxa]|uniref:DNA 3'-5' helicase n=1 Tax=Schizopora paradoxa TaxID=27342 RepID=A0A0H2SHD4_9AGAM|nr:P-loop containing nucleoside triphosphate hydrolase protein [Schizopora paradoxa]
MTSRSNGDDPEAVPVDPIASTRPPKTAPAKTRPTIAPAVRTMSPCIAFPTDPLRRPHCVVPPHSLSGTTHCLPLPLRARPRAPHRVSSPLRFRLRGAGTPRARARPHCFGAARRRRAAPRPWSSPTRNARGNGVRDEPLKTYSWNSFLVRFAHFPSPTLPIPPGCQLFIANSKMKNAKGKRMTCPAEGCNANFHLDGDLDVHLTTKHHGLNLLRCTKGACTESFSTMALRQAHCQVEHDPVCHAVVQGKRATVVRDERDVFICPIVDCPFETNKSGELTAHVSDAHHTGAISFRPGNRVTRAVKGGMDVSDVRSALGAPASLPPPAVGDASADGTAMDVDDPVAEREDEGLVTSPPSSHTSATSPPSTDVIVKDADLSVIDLVVHTGFKIAICKECKVGVCADDLQVHAKSHSNKTLPFPKVQAAIERYGLLNGPAVELPPFFEAPISVLQTPVNGYYCTLCYGRADKKNYACSDTSTRNRHMTKHHPDLKGRGSEFFNTCQVQFLFLFKAYKAYFAVDLSKVPPLSPISPADRLREHLNAIRPNEGERVFLPPVDERVMSQFLHETKWPHCIVGANTDELVTLVRIPEPTEDLHNVCQAVAGYFKFVAENITDTLSTFNLRSIAAKDGNLTSRKFSNPEQADTLAKNIEEGVKLVLFVTRKRMGHCASYPVPFSREQMVAIDSLILACRESAITMEHIHNVLFALVSNEILDSSDMLFSHVVERFLISFARKTTGKGWIRLPELSSMLARLQWCVRTCVLFDGHLHSSEYENGRNGAFHDRFKFIRTNSPYAFNTICEVKATLSRCINGAPKMPNTIISPDREVIAVGGNPISVSALQNGISGMIDDLAKELHEKVCCGHSFLALDKTINDSFDSKNTNVYVHDNLRTDKVGYSFFEDERNPFAQYRDLLFEKVMDREVNTFTGDNPLYTEDPDGTLHFDQSEIRKWFARVDDFMKNLCGVIALTCGGPFRTPELALTTLNVNEDGYRTLCFICEHIVFLLHYVKSRGIKGVDDLIPKAVCQRVSKILIKYLTIVLPVIQAFVEERFGQGCHAIRKLYDEYLFVAGGKRYEREEVTASILQVTKNHCGASISVSELRHIVKAILLYYIGEDTDSVELVSPDPEEDAPGPVVDPVAKVFGHSADTAAREYAILDESAPTTRLPYFNRCLEVAYSMHKFYGEGIPDIKGGKDGQVVCIPSEKRTLDAVVSGVVAGLKANFEEFALAHLLPAMERVTIDSSTRIASGLALRSSNALHPTQLVPAENVYGLQLHPRFLKALRKLLNDENASFRTREQIVMVDMISRARHHGLVVMPTGSGKSVGIFIHALLETKGITVVVVPFVPLLLDFEARAAAMPHITWARFPGPVDVNNTRVVFIQLELATTDNVLAWLEHVSNCGLLRRIILDEGHVVLTDAHYRSVLKRLCVLTTINVPITLLSATVSIASQDELVACVGLPPSSVHVVRSPCTARLNIRYEVVRVEPGGVMDAIVACIEDEFPLAPTDRGVIWFSRIADGNAFSERTGIPFVNAGPDCKRKEILDAWKDGEWLAGTSCMGQGIDKPNIRVSLHHCSPFNLTQLAQETGRAGRDGAPSVARLIWDKPNTKPPTSPEDHAGVEALREALTNPPPCWRIPLSLKFDGVGRDCFSTPSATLCSRCDDRMATDTPLEDRFDELAPNSNVFLEHDEQDDDGEATGEVDTSDSWDVPATSQSSASDPSPASGNSDSDVFLVPQSNINRTKDLAAMPPPPIFRVRSQLENVTEEFPTSHANTARLLGQGTPSHRREKYFRSIQPVLAAFAPSVEDTYASKSYQTPQQYSNTSNARHSAPSSTTAPSFPRPPTTITASRGTTSTADASSTRRTSAFPVAARQESVAGSSRAGTLPANTNQVATPGSSNSRPSSTRRAVTPGSATSASFPTSSLEFYSSKPTNSASSSSRAPSVKENSMMQKEVVDKQNAVMRKVVEVANTIREITLERGCCSVCYVLDIMQEGGHKEGERVHHKLPAGCRLRIGGRLLTNDSSEYATAFKNEVIKFKVHDHKRCWKCFLPEVHIQDHLIDRVRDEHRLDDIVKPFLYGAYMLPIFRDGIFCAIDKTFVSVEKLEDYSRWLSRQRTGGLVINAYEVLYQFGVAYELIEELPEYPAV